ncbi:unnamed protein product [Chrysodeixis includens]|uniref:snRNA-activating protein complex subunit 1 n=1 Tax=Chrysodeixis includens TaxID=689277 RepID=A0A9P0BW59_CHRIL|nr:unnamed protein product [Chrysodeixis includens]
MSQHIKDAYIADGFADDCDELIHRLTSGIGRLTYAAFVREWKDMQMSGIYHERSSGAEIAELSEEVIHIAKRYMVADTSNFEGNIAGLFLVYALLNIQPFTGFAHLRVVQDDIPAIERIEFVARRDRRMDVLYILGSVLIKGPVQYHAALRERGMEYPYRKYLEGNSNINNLGVRPKGVFYRQGREMDLIRELKSLSMQYDKVKEEIAGPGVEDPNLKYYDMNFATKLEKSFKKLITGTLDSDDDDDDEGGEPRPGCSSYLVKDVDHIRSIKDRAMKAKVDPVKHLVGVAGNSSSAPSATVTSENTAKSKKPVNYIDLAVPSSSKTYSRKRKRRETDEQSNESGDDYSIQNDNNINNSEPSTSVLPDLNLDTFTQPQSTKTVSKDKAKTQEVEIQNIELESLPCVIQSETDGNSYEIEIIDNMSNQEASTSQAVVEEKNMRAEKRDLKKTILKSRFKRMGMLPVANFPPE